MGKASLHGVINEHMKVHLLMEIVLVPVSLPGVMANNILENGGQERNMVMELYQARGA